MRLLSTSFEAHGNSQNCLHPFVASATTNPGKVLTSDWPGCLMRRVYSKESPSHETLMFTHMYGTA